MRESNRAAAFSQTSRGQGELDYSGARFEASARGGGRIALVSLCGLSLGLGGCALRGAPSYSIFGAFFPAWLLCAVLGIFASILLRTVLIATDFEEAVPFKLLVYLAFAVGSTLWLWLALFGES